MGNPKLEKLQKKSRDKDLQRGEVSFTCNDSSVTCNESSKISLESEGIRLHFLRYGLFDYEVLEEDIKAPKAVLAGEEDAETFTLLRNDATGEVIDVNNETNKSTKGIALDEILVDSNPFKKYGMPKLENFGVARTALRNGYIYLINEEDSNEYYELKADQNGFLSHILWEYNKDENGEYLDVRKSEKEKISYKIVEKGKKLLMAFSPVQWSRDYFNEINGDDNKKKEIMQLIDCSGFPKDHQAEETALAIPFNQIKASFSPEHGYASTLEDNLKDIFITEREQTKIAEEGGDTNEILEDMFITFHDPIACADDILAGLANQNFRLKALVEAIQTGCTEDFAYDRISTMSTNPPKTPTEDYKNMFSLALASYQFVYNNKKSTKDYDGGSVADNLFESRYESQFPYQPSYQSYYDNENKSQQTNNARIKIKTGRRRKPKGFNYQFDGFVGNGLHREKVEGVLGVQQRRARREQLISYRNDLGNWIQSEYFNNILFMYIDNIYEYVVFGMAECYKYTAALYENPYDADRSLLLNANHKLEIDRYHESDQWIDWINKVRGKNKSTKNNLEILLTNDVTIKQVLMDGWVDLSNKFTGVITGMLSVHAVNKHYFNSKKVTNKRGIVNYQEILEEGYQKKLQKLNKIKIERTIDGKVVEAFTFSNTQGFQMNANAFGGNFDPNLTVTVMGPDNKLLSKFQTEAIEHIKHGGGKAPSSSGRFGGKKRPGKTYNELNIGDRVKTVTEDAFNDNTTNKINSQRYDERAFKILNSRGFTSLLTGLQVVNFSYASLSLFLSLIHI